MDFPLLTLNYEGVLFPKPRDPGYTHVGHNPKMVNNLWFTSWLMPDNQPHLWRYLVMSQGLRHGIADSVTFLDTSWLRHCGEITCRVLATKRSNLQKDLPSKKNVCICNSCVCLVSIHVYIGAGEAM